MLRYVAILWNPFDTRGATIAASLCVRYQQHASAHECIFQAPGMAVFTGMHSAAGLTTYGLPDCKGIVLGRLFPTSMELWHSDWIPVIDERAARKMLETSGRYLTENFWGSYIALLRNTDGTQSVVVRDCSGKIPCYCTDYENVHIFCADIGDLGPLSLPRFTVNWRYLAAFIYSDRLQIRESGFNEITELLAGESLDIRPDSLRHIFAWDPRLCCETGKMADYAVVRSALRETAQGCVDAWASAHHSILLRLSGGLDSSIVLGCLSRSRYRPSVVCVNEFGLSKSDDERRYARLAASQARVPLIEQFRDITKRVVDPAVFAAQRVGKPNISSLDRAIEIEAINQIVDLVEAEAVWTGQCGDHIFYQMKTSLGAADYIAERGINWGVLTAVCDAARLSREPYLVVLRNALKLARSRACWMPSLFLDFKSHFVNRERLGKDVDEYVSTPWAGGMESLPKGKQYQILLLAECLNRHRSMPALELAEEHHPLQSQPLIELCLRIPSYILLQGGRQRALARDAFSDCLPSEVARREDKGETSWVVREFVRRNESSIQGLLLGGILAREQIIVRSELEPYLVKHQPMRVEHYWALLACLAAEMWLRSWSERTVSLAA